MATLDTKTADPFASIESLGWDEKMDKENEIFDKLQEVSDSLPTPLYKDGKHLVPATELPSTMVGRIIAFPWADGHAFYRVTSAKPFKIQHLRYCDCWSVPIAMIRGLRLADAANMVVRELKIKALFDKKKA